MIHYEYDPKTERAEVDVDLATAFKESTDMEGFLVNAGLEAQAAILAILARMVQTIDYVSTDGKGLPKEHLKAVKELLVKVASVDVKLLDEFMDG